MSIRDDVTARLAAGADLAATAASIEHVAGPDDAIAAGLVAWLREGVTARDGRFDLRVAVRAVATVLRPAAILDIGSRHGWSLVQALGAAPHAYVLAIDMFVPGYAGCDNPGPARIAATLERVGVPADRVEVLALDSHVALPALAGRRPWPGSAAGEERARALGRRAPRRFDLVVVDGDHSAAGALLDLLDAEPLLAPGGALLFDDLLDFSDDVRPDLPGLRPDLRAPQPPTLAGAFAELCERHPDWDVIAPRGPHDCRAGPCAIALPPTLARDPSAP